jgi:hypothetical protein
MMVAIYHPYIRPVLPIAEEHHNVVDQMVAVYHAYVARRLVLLLIDEVHIVDLCQAVVSKIAMDDFCCVIW